MMNNHGVFLLLTLVSSTANVHAQATAPNVSMGEAASKEAAGPMKGGTRDLLQGVTLYGTVDIGVAHLSHGAPLSAYYGPWVAFSGPEIQQQIHYLSCPERFESIETRHHGNGTVVGRAIGRFPAGNWFHAHVRKPR